jgi:hypothetical protein
MSGYSTVEEMEATGARDDFTQGRIGTAPFAILY